MQLDFLNTLHCPYSGSDLRIKNAIRGDNDVIDFGIVESEAGEFPIIAGILRLRIDELQTGIVALLEKGDLESALLTAMELPFHGRRSMVINFLTRATHTLGLGRVGKSMGRFKRGFHRALREENGTFLKAIGTVRSPAGVNGQKYRFSMPTFLSVYPLLHLLRSSDSVLDFGCGTGQGSFLISTMVPDARIVCADYSFSVLCIAKTFFLHRANFVCLDGDYPLPFASGDFSTVFSADALHCIDSKLSLAKEFKRVLSQRGSVILPHLHNRLARASYGKSLSPEGYGRLFEGMERRVLVEEKTIADYVFNDILDLEKQLSDEDLIAAETGISIVASNDKSVFRYYSGLWDQHIDRMNRPIVNPVYNVSGQPGHWALRRRAPELYAKHLSRGDQVFLPDVVTLRLPSLESQDLQEVRRSDRAEFRKLARSFVVIDAPDRFGA